MTVADRTASAVGVRCSAGSAMSVMLLLIPQGPGGLATRGSSRRPLRDETETVPGLVCWTGLSFSRCLLLITRRSRLLSFRGRVSQGQADEVIRACVPCFFGRRLATDWYGAGTARTVGRSQACAAACCCCPVLLLLVPLEAAPFSHLRFLAPVARPGPRGEGGRYNYHVYRVQC